MKRLRHTIAFVLALLLTLTSQQMALARGQASPVGMMVMCLGGAAVSVAVDAEGRPTNAPHNCPDCALTLVAAVASPVLVTFTPVAQPVTYAWLRAPDAAPLSAPSPHARGPPVLI